MGTAEDNRGAPPINKSATLFFGAHLRSAIPEKTRVRIYLPPRRPGAYGATQKSSLYNRETTNAMNALEFRFAFYAKDFDRSVHFYQDTLGMSYLSGWDRADGKGALFSAGGTAVVEIYGAAEGHTYKGPAPVAINLALRLRSVADVDQTFEQLRSRGVRVGGPPENRSWGHRSFIVFDPDLIPVHVYCELDESQ
jgi:catechol 2,3-dioxygenase-like lactoylglutathione lyase family enzyme